MFPIHNFETELFLANAIFLIKICWSNPGENLLVGLENSENDEKHSRNDSDTGFPLLSIHSYKTEEEPALTGLLDADVSFLPRE
jgi:hypothetical protein